MTTTLRVEAYGVYKGPLYPELQDEEAQLCRYNGVWVAARFLTEGVTIHPTGEDFLIDPSKCWILLHVDDFDIIKGEVGPCDWCSSFDFRCTGMCKNLSAETRRDGSIIIPANDPLRELARLIGQHSVHSYTDHDRNAPEPADMVVERITPDEYLREELLRSVRTCGGVPYEYEPNVVRRPYQYTTRLVMIIAACWFVTGVIIGWWGTYTWPWW